MMYINKFYQGGTKFEVLLDIFAYRMPKMVFFNHSEIC